MDLHTQHQHNPQGTLIPLLGIVHRWLRFGTKASLSQGVWIVDAGQGWIRDICSGIIWALLASRDKNLQELVNLALLDPLLRILPWWLRICPSGFRKSGFVSIRIFWSHISTFNDDGSWTPWTWSFPKNDHFWWIQDPWKMDPSNLKLGHMVSSHP